jgi:methyltransferase-like protein
LHQACLAEIVSGDPAWVAHEYLNAHTSAQFFPDLVARAAAHGLAYVGDAPSSDPALREPHGLREALLERELAGDLLEASLDAITGRPVRHSLFCHADAPRQTRPGPEQIAHLYVRSQLAPKSAEPPPRGNDANAMGGQFVGDDGTLVESSDPILTHVLWALARVRPDSRRINDLLDDARRATTASGVAQEWAYAERQEFCRTVRLLHMQGQLTLSLRPLPLATPTRYPTWTAHRLARHEAKARGSVTTPLHTVLPLSPISQAVVLRLDGSRNEAELVDDLVSAVWRRELDLRQYNVAVTHPVRLAALARQAYAETIAYLAPWGILTG